MKARINNLLTKLAYWLLSKRSFVPYIVPNNKDYKGHYYHIHPNLEASVYFKHQEYGWVWYGSFNNYFDLVDKGLVPITCEKFKEETGITFAQALKRLEVVTI